MSTNQENQDLFDRVLDTIRSNQINHIRGNVNCIPFQNFTRLEDLIVGIEKSSYYCITAGTGVGKSRLARALFIDSPIDYIAKHRILDIKVNIILFSLEESKEKIILTRISKELYTRFGISVSTKQLRSIGTKNLLHPNTLEKIELVKKEVTEFYNNVTIVDHISNPTGIFKYCKDYLLANGTVHTKKGKIPDKESVHDIFDYYIPNDDAYNIFIIDNYNCLKTESGKSLNECMQMMSTYAVELMNKYQATIVAVHQQALSQESAFNIKEDLTEPSLAGFGDNKTISRDMTTVIGLHAPDRFKNPKYEGFTLKNFNSQFRSLIILKQRDDFSIGIIPTIQHGATGIYYELPDIKGLKTPAEIDAVCQSFYDLTNK